MKAIARAFLNWLIRRTVERKRGERQSCATCCHFIDYRDTEPDDEVNGYCSQLVNTLGFEKALNINPYGGGWTHHESWCRDWEGGAPVWGERQAPLPAPPREDV